MKTIKMKILDRPWKNVSELIGQISNYFVTHHPYNPRKKEIWFRGQSDSEYKLLPTAFREKDKEGSIPRYDEAGALADFQAHYPENRQEYTSIIEWLTLMQHYGLPTRLLDWSRSIFVALYYAVQDHDKDGALYALDPSFFGRDSHIHPDSVYQKLISLCVLFDDTVPFVETVNMDPLLQKWKIRAKTGDQNKENPAGKDGYDVVFETPDSDGEYLYRAFRGIHAITPPRLNNRLVVQQGTFTLHGGKLGQTLRIQPMDLEEDDLREIGRATKKPPIKINISRDKKEALSRELDFAGINEAALYPEMEYQAKHIRIRNTFKYSTIPEGLDVVDAQEDDTESK